MTTAPPRKMAERVPGRADQEPKGFSNVRVGWRVCVENPLGLTSAGQITTAPRPRQICPDAEQL